MLEGLGTSTRRNHSPKALIRARKSWTRTWTHRAMVRPHANQNLVMLHTLKRSVPIPCGSNTQDFDCESLFGKGFVSQAVPPAADDEKKFHQDREAARFTAAEQPIKSISGEVRRSRTEVPMAIVFGILIMDQSVQIWTYPMVEHGAGVRRPSDTADQTPSLQSQFRKIVPRTRRSNLGT